jgi:hypothetical protein
VSNSKLHHHVPQFYLRRFTDPAGRPWVWDRDRDRVFSTRPGSVAAESDFYFLRELAEHGHDPLTMESQFADLESDISAVTGQWLDWIRHGEPGDACSRCRPEIWPTQTRMSTVLGPIQRWLGARVRVESPAAQKSSSSSDHFAPIALPRCSISCTAALPAVMLSCRSSN